MRFFETQCIPSHVAQLSFLSLWVRCQSTCVGVVMWQEGGVNYGELFAYALRSFGILCIGLYRFRDALSSVTQDPSAKRYVITNPPDDFQLLTSDKVYLLPVYIRVGLLCGWLGGVVVSVLDSWLGGHWFNSQPRHSRATTLGKLFTPMCLCSPSSISWYLATSFVWTRLYVAANGMVPMNKGSIVVAVLQQSWSLGHFA